MLSYVSAGPRKETPRYVDVGLVDAMRALSFKVPYTGMGLSGLSQTALAS